jgi:hypothetical protein
VFDDAEYSKVLELVDASGLPYQLTPSGTCIEGEWEEPQAPTGSLRDHVAGSRCDIQQFDRHLSSTTQAYAIEDSRQNDDI